MLVHTHLQCVGRAPGARPGPRVGGPAGRTHRHRRRWGSGSGGSHAGEGGPQSLVMNPGYSPGNVAEGKSGFAEPANRPDLDTVRDADFKAAGQTADGHRSYSAGDRQAPALRGVELIRGREKPAERLLRMHSCWDPQGAGPRPRASHLPRGPGLLALPRETSTSGFQERSQTLMLGQNKEAFTPTALERTPPLPASLLASRCLSFYQPLHSFSCVSPSRPFSLTSISMYSCKDKKINEHFCAPSSGLYTL